MANLKISELTSAAALTGSEVVPIVQGTSTVKTTVQDIANLAGLGGPNYVFVAASGTNLENAIELQAAYNTAKTMSPSATNRVSVVAAPGEYKLASPLVLDTEFIDLVSLTGNADVVFDLVPDPVTQVAYNITNIIYPLVIAADNVFVKGIDGKEVSSAEYDIWWGDPTPFKLGIDIVTDLPNIVVENCNAGSWSFGADYTYGDSPSLSKNISGKFINCTAYFESFAYYGVASGQFINCHVVYTKNTGYPTDGGYAGFGSSGTASGYFENCSCDEGYFSSLASASGTFINCVGGQLSFGDTASGIFTNCTATTSSFGKILASGTFTHCVATTNSFGNSATGVFTNCQAGNYSFGTIGTVSGTFTECTAGDYSFGSSFQFQATGIVTGTFTECTAGDYSFGYNDPNRTATSVSGTFKNCTSGSNSFGQNQIASGTFIGCKADFNSFGSGFALGDTGGFASGTFIDCEAINGACFGRVASGFFQNCTSLGDYSFGYNICSGVFIGCRGGVGAFSNAGGGSLTGQLYYCTLVNSSFPTVTGTGVTRYCLNSDNTTDNQG